MSKTVIRLQDEVLLEYDYQETSENVISNKLYVIENLYDNSKIILKNGQDKYSSAETTNNFTIINEDGVYDLASVDQNINKIIPDLAESFIMKYNIIRINLASGFNFIGNDGFNLKIYTYSKTGQKIYFADFVYIRKFSSIIQYNSTPIKLSEAIFDKYLEIQIPSLEYWLMLQDIKSEDVFNVIGDNLVTDHALYFEYSLVNYGEYVNGFYKFLLVDTIKNQLVTQDKYTNLSGFIQLSTEGDYFEYQLRYNNEQIEDFIYKLNSISGNNFYIIHTINVIEQVGDTYIEADKYTTIQNNNFQKLFKFRPVIQNNNISSISIDYTVQLINSSDGMGVTITSSVSTLNTSIFGNKLIQLDILPTKFDVYNHIVKTNRNIATQIDEVIKTIVVDKFVDKFAIKSSDEAIEIAPLKKTLLLEFTDTSGSSKEIPNSVVYYLTFPNSASSKVEIKETIDSTISKTNGQLLFTIDEATSKKIYEVSNNSTCYVVGKSLNGNNESIFSKFKYTLD